MSENIDLSTLNIPEHVAIILDGNGRWAKNKHMPRTYGHTVGSKVVERTVEDASDIGIKYLTVYVFSTENWKRSQDEVSMLFSLIERYLRSLIKKSKKNNVRCRVIGRRDNMSSSMLQVIESLKRKQRTIQVLHLLLQLTTVEEMRLQELFRVLLRTLRTVSLTLRILLRAQ